MITGFICGAWDLLHPGHLYTFKMCKQLCDYLIVGLQVNPQTERKTKNKPIETIYERYLRLMGCKYVDEIIPYETDQDLINILHMTPIDVRFLGEDYIDNEEKIIGRNIREIRYLPRGHNYSSTNLRKRL